MRVAFYTLGCKLNQCETETLASLYARQGFFIVPWSEKADMYICNTCTVTSKSEQKARRVLRKVKRENPEAVICITGCYAEVAGEELRNLFPEAVVLPIEKKMALADAAGEIRRIDTEELPQGGKYRQTAAVLEGLLRPSMGKNTVFINAVESDRFRSRPYFKIQDGCNNRCAYCRVPAARGRSRSLDADSVVCGVRELENNGYGEVVLTGVNISLYRSTDGDGVEYRLPGLLGAVLANTESIRLRLSSIEPEALTPELLRILGHSRIRPHFHLPIQSGSEHILTLMNRKYTADQLKEAVHALREIKENPFISADVIVGFPGERDSDFEETEDLIRALRFSKLHVFQFSKRPDTPAFDMKPSVPERIMKQRSQRLINLSEELYRRYTESWLHRTLEAVVEEAGRSGGKQGTTENYIHIGIRGPGAEKLVPGKNCRIKLSKNDEIYGELIS